MDVITAPNRKQRNGRVNRAPAQERANGRVAKQAGRVSQDVQDLGGMVKDAAHQKLEDLRDTAAEYTDQGRDHVQQWGRTIEEYIQQRPLQTVLVAAGVGLLLGRFWMRR